MLALQDLHEAASGWRIVAVNLGEPAAMVASWVEALGLTYEFALDPAGLAARAFGLRGAPSTYLLDADGRIRRVFYGAVSAAALRQAIESFGTTL